MPYNVYVGYNEQYIHALLSTSHRSHDRAGVSMNRKTCRIEIDWKAGKRPNKLVETVFNVVEAFLCFDDPKDIQDEIMGLYEVSGCDISPDAD